MMKETKNEIDVKDEIEVKNEIDVENQNDVKEEIQVKEEIEVKDENEARGDSEVGNPRRSVADELRELLQIVREAEAAAYERGKREGSKGRESRQFQEAEDIWSNRRLNEAEAESKNMIKAGDEFLTRIRPSVWD